jgi:hypothetical protein
MLYTDEFLESLKHDPIAGVKQACQLALEQLANDSQEWTNAELEALEEADVLMMELRDADLLPVQYSRPVLSSDATRGKRASTIRATLVDVLKSLEKLELQARRERLASRFRVGLGVKFAYEFSQGDLDRIQSLLNELRSLVSASEKFKPEHQQRILSRLETLQRELHKKVSDLDRFWGLVGDAGVMLAKLGNDAKPIVDRVREIADIVWNTQGRAEELPSTARPPQIGYESPQDGDSTEA